MTEGSRIRESFLSERLHHFFARAGDEDGGIAIFKSISQNGLLLTVGNQAGEADVFTFDTADGTVVTHVAQSARVCFTDIPEDKLAAHSDDAQYGRFAIGFKRETIVSWAGSPVWYLPNNAEGKLAGAAGVLVQYLTFGQVGLTVLESLYNTPICRPPISFGDGAVMDPDVVVKRSMLARGSISRALSFVKEMSPRNAPGKEFEYLYEREWRIVADLQVGDETLFHPLPPEFRETLLKSRPEWAMPIKCVGDFFKDEYFTQPMIDHFRLFNGLGSADSTVAKQIANVFVPTQTAKAAIEAYMRSNAALFADPLPEIKIFGNSSD
jgi:hypothetical protein